MRRTPFFLSYALWATSANTCQSAAVVLELVRQFTISGWDPHQRIALGGDSELCYSAVGIAAVSSETDSARRCRLLSLPTRLFYTAAFPLLLQSLRPLKQSCVWAPISLDLHQLMSS